MGIKLQIALCLLSSSFCLKAQVKKIDLGNYTWKFKNHKESNWLPAKVPGSVHQDLLNAKKIPDPFIGANEKLVQWVAEEDWDYSSNFNLSKTDYSFENQILELEGIDLFAQVYVNGKWVGSTQNQFRKYQFQLKGKLKIGLNTIQLHFKSSLKEAKRLSKNLPYSLPAPEYPFVRKAAYQFGWDWGPRLITTGIGKIGLVCWSKVKITNTQINTQLSIDSIAKLEFSVNLQASEAGAVQVSVQAKEPNIGQQVKEVIQLNKGANNVKLYYYITKPKLWWSNGLGQPYLYNFTLTVSKNGGTIDSETYKVGIRKIELVQNKDEWGTTFFFRLNGKPVFMKGANWIPPNSFLNGLNPNTYQNLIKEAKNANLNMLRVWGGGVYPVDAFYDACDENGILVWQDLQFANSMYPGDSSFFENVAAEIKDQATRLRNHASLALWCGNNEISEGWNNWGWQKQFGYTFSDSVSLANNYKSLFEQTIPKLLKSLDPNHPYWPSSPSIGWGKPESLLQGDAHYWGVWWGMEPFEKYEQKVGRFMSEYGFQGMPSLQTFAKFMPGFPEAFDSASYFTHQKHPTGYPTIDTYLERDYKIPKDFENKVSLSQLLQARGMKIAIESHRRAKPYCMGTLFWQWNDCWPVTSWSAIDFGGNRKALYYQVKRSYQPTLLSFEPKKDTLYLHLVVDGLKVVKGNVKVELMDFNGLVYWTKFIQVRAGSAESVRVDCITQFPKETDTTAQRKMLIKAVFENETDTLLALHYFAKPKDLELPQPNVKLKWVQPNLIEISTDKLAKDVYLFSKQKELHLSDNFFDLYPNQVKRIFISEQIGNSEVKAKSIIDTRKP